MICNVYIGLLLIEHILSTYLYVLEWIQLNGPYRNIKDYANGNVGYHAAILIALKFLKLYSIHDKYSEFLDLRVEADYNVVNIITYDDAKNAVDLAEDICRKLH